jgi:hypothetical protein
MDSYLDIDESTKEYFIDNLVPGSDKAINLWAKHMEKYVSRARFWKPRLDIAKKCFEFEARNILTPTQRKKYWEQDKWPIEPQVMRPIVAALERMIEKAVPGSDITYEDETPPETAASPDVAKTVISWIKHKLEIHDIRKKTLHKGLVGGYPQCFWVEKARTNDLVFGGLPIKAVLRPWDSCLPPEYYSSEDGSDIDDIVFLKDVTKNELYEKYPERVKAHKDHINKIGEDEGYTERFKSGKNNDTSRDRSNLIFGQITEAKFNSISGRYFAIESIFPIRKKRMVYINTETNDFIPIPPDWSYEKQVEFEDIHPEYDFKEEIDVNVLWVVTITSDGFIWENREHWYQMDGKLPAAWYIPDTVNNQPMGMGEDLLPYVLLKTASKIEGLDQVRKGTGRVTVFEEGTIKNSQNINKELSSPEGVIIAKRGTPAKNVIATFNRTPNTTFLEYEDRISNEMKSVHFVDKFAMGATVNRQSADAKEMQYDMALSPQTRYVDNYYSYNLQIENLLCEVIPIAIPKSFIVQIKDEFGQAQKPVEVNQIGFNQESDEATIIANDLTNARYRAIPIIGDDSMASRENQMREFMELLAAIGNQLFKLDPIFLGQMFSKFPNRFAREASVFLVEYGERQQQQQGALRQEELAIDEKRELRLQKTNMEKIRRPKVAFNLSPEDIKNAPESAKLMFNWMNMYDNQMAEKEQEEQEQYKQQQQTEQPAETQAA